MIDDKNEKDIDETLIPPVNTPENDEIFQYKPVE